MPNINSIFLFLFITTLPFQEDLPTIGGFSVPAIITIFLGFNAFIKNPNRLLYFVKSKLSLLFFVFILVSIVMETIHPYSSYKGIIRVVNMYLGGIVLAFYIRNSKDFFKIINYYVIAALIMSAFVLPFGWRVLASTAVLDFEEANFLRGQIQQAILISNNVNNIAYSAMLGAVICLFKIIFLNGKKFENLVVFFILFMTVLTSMSRGGLIIVVFSTILTLIYFRKINSNRIPSLIIIFLAGIFIMPKSYLVRLVGTRTEQSQSGGELALDSRKSTYEASVEEIKKNFLFGVGEGNMFTSYGFKTKLVMGDEYGMAYRVGGTHNMFFGTVLHYGLLGILFYILFIYKSIKMLPFRRSPYPEDIYLTLFSFAGLTLLFFMHDGSNKEYTIIYGLLLAHYHFLRYQQKMILQAKNTAKDSMSEPTANLIKQN